MRAAQDPELLSIGLSRHQSESQSLKVIYIVLYDTLFFAYTAKMSEPIKTIIMIVGIFSYLLKSFLLSYIKLGMSLRD